MTCRKEPPTSVDSKPIYRTIISLLIVLLTIGLSACKTNPIGENPGDMTETTPMETDLPLPPYYPTPEPEELEACLEKGGKWDVLGKSGPGCNLPTGDGGKTCQDSEECESLCLADTDEVMQEDAGVLVPNPQRIEQLNSQKDQISGACSNWRSNFGCRVVVEEGKYQEICID